MRGRRIEERGSIGKESDRWGQRDGIILYLRLRHCRQTATATIGGNQKREGLEEMSRLGRVW